LVQVRENVYDSHTGEQPLIPLMGHYDHLPCSRSSPTSAVSPSAGQTPVRTIGRHVR